jgi:tRNA A37 threonylcarbamoyladenosine synthetase subunit TsaC/SUA5/YrdC
VDSTKVYLAQTDTTVGFLSSDGEKLSRVKQRSLSKKTLQVVDSFKTLKKNTRIPNKYKSKVRRAKKTTFIYPNGLGFRVVPKEDLHHNFIKKFGKMYSTSANLTKQNFEREFALKNAEVILYTSIDFNETISSRIFKLTNKKEKKVR